jgi:O-antigen/teichoic acid export membrane protein
VLNIFLIPILGVVGAAAATVITNATVVAMNVFFIHRELHLSVRKLLFTTARISGLTTVMAGTVWLVVPFISSILSLIAVVTAGVFVWAVLAIVGGLLDVEEIRSFLPSKI